MGVVFRQSVKNSIVTAAGAMLGAFTTWLATKYLPRREYGFIGTFTSLAVSIGPLLLVGLNSTLVVYIHKYTQDDKKRNLLIALCFLIPLLFVSVASGFWLLAKGWVLAKLQIEDQVFMEAYYYWLPLFALMFVYMTIAEQFLGSQMKVAAPALMREVIFRIGYIILIVLFAAGSIPFGTLLKGNILLYLLPVLAMFAMAVRLPAFGMSLSMGNFTKDEYRDMAKFTWYHFLLAASIQIIAYLDAILLPFYSVGGFQTTAVYRNALVLISFIQIPLRALLPASFTALARAFAEDNREKAGDLYLRSSINIFLVTVCISVLIACNLHNVLAIIPDGYSEMVPVFHILLLGNLVNVMTGMNDQILSITNYYQFNLILSLLLGVSLYFLIRTLVPMYDVYGAAWSTTISLVIFNFIKTVFIYRKLGMLPFSMRTLRVLVAAIPALGAGYLLPRLFDGMAHVYISAMADAAVRSLAIVLIYVAMLLWLKPSADLDEYLVTVRKNKRLF